MYNKSYEKLSNRIQEEIFNLYVDISNMQNGVKEFCEDEIMINRDFIDYHNQMLDFIAALDEEEALCRINTSV